MASREEHRLEAERLINEYRHPGNTQEALTLALVHAILATGPERPALPPRLAGPG